MPTRSCALRRFTASRATAFASCMRVPDIEPEVSMTSASEVLGSRFSVNWVNSTGSTLRSESVHSHRYQRSFTTREHQTQSLITHGGY